MPHLVARLLATWKPTAVVAVDRWEIIDFVGANGVTRATRTPAHVAETEGALADVSRAITSSGARLAFIELPPILPGECFKKDKRQGLQCQVPAASDAVQIPYNEAFRHLAVQVPHVSTISVTDVVCPDGLCSPEVDGIQIRYDGLHFSPAGAGWLAPSLYQRLTDSGVISR
jgi:lysophospholipase L1-like esterase